MISAGQQLNSVTDYILTAKTPYIHFQYSQTGATLRATEVKPKLDKFLKTHAIDELKPHFFIKDTQALNYKMSFFDLGKVKNANLQITGFKFYFANTGLGKGSTKAKDFVFRDVKMRIICPNAELRAIIDKYVKAFFVLHNFGARQSKGFGGFLIEGTSENEIKSAFGMVNTINFSFTTGQNSNISELFGKAATVYSVMKSGNRKAGGFILKHYFEGVRNDKAFMREQVLESPSLPHEGYAFVRAILGLADHYAFNDKYFKGTITVLHYEGTTYESDGWSVPISSIKADKGIKRFRSPVTIKFFDNRVVFMLANDDDVYEPLLGQPFFVLTEAQKNDLAAAKNAEAVAELLRTSACIKTPDQFDRKDFVNSFVEYFNQNRQSGITLVGGI